MRVRCPILIGRRDELARLVALADDARGGHGGAVVISGPPGIGKSRLARQLTDESLLPVVAAGRCVPTTAVVPYRPLIEAVLGLSRQRPLPSPSELGVFGAPLAAVVADWAPHAEFVAPPSPVVLGEGLLRLIGAVASDGCLVVLEDLHWADEESLAVIEYLCDHAAHTAIAIVATIRPGESQSAHAAVTALVGRGAADLLHLVPLRPSEVAEMVAACGSNRSADEVAVAAEGLPLLVEEILGMDDDGERTTVPTTVQESVRRQLAAVGVRPALAVLAGALLGRRFDWEVVVGALGEDPGDVVACLRRALDAGLLDSDGIHFRFRHA